MRVLLRLLQLLGGWPEFAYQTRVSRPQTAQALKRTYVREVALALDLELPTDEPIVTDDSLNQQAFLATYGQMLLRRMAGVSEGPQCSLYGESSHGRPRALRVRGLTWRQTLCGRRNATSSPICGRGALVRRLRS